MLKNYINSLLIIANKIQENQLNEIINTINKAIKNKKKSLFVEMVVLHHYPNTLYVTGQKDFIPKKSCNYLISHQINHL